MLQFAKPEVQKRDRKSQRLRFLRCNDPGRNFETLVKLESKLGIMPGGREPPNPLATGCAGKGTGSFSTKRGGRCVAGISQRQPDSRFLGGMGRLGPRWNGFIHLRPGDGARTTRIAPAVRYS